MSEWITPSSLGQDYYIGLVALIMAVLWAWLHWRNSRLSRIDPPTPEELEEIREMQRTGTFRLSGRSSVVSRHFGHETKTDSDRNYGGTPNLHEATVIDSWRDRRKD